MSDILHLFEVDKTQDTAKDATWEKATSVITSRILALRERQAAEAKESAK